MELRFGPVGITDYRQLLGQFFQVFMGKNKKTLQRWAQKLHKMTLKKYVFLKKTKKKKFQKIYRQRIIFNCVLLY